MNKIDTSFNVDGHIIEGSFHGDPKSWVFKSNSDYFIQQFPHHEVGSDYIHILYDKDNSSKTTNEVSVYEKIMSESLFYLDRVPYSFKSNSYENLYQTAIDMSVHNIDQTVSYVCAPLDKHDLRSFKDNYLLPDVIKNFRPRLFQEFTLYEVKRVEVFNTDEIDLELKPVYDLSIKIESV